MATCASSAWAQATISDTLETVEVTAQKRTQNLQEVPISVQAISAAELEKSGIKDLFNLSDISPSITGGQANRTIGARMGIRGVNDFARNPGYDSSMGVYVDGVFAGRTESASQSLVGIDKIEVLRGPQGTLFGKNTVAGALSLTTRKPGNELAASASFDVGSYGTKNVGIWVGGALVPDKVQMSLSLGHEETDGWVDNLTQPGNRPGSGKGDSARVLTRFITSPTTTADLALWTYKYSGVPAFGEATGPGILVPYDPVVPGSFTAATNYDSKESIDKTGGSFTFDLEPFQGYKLTSITSVQKATNFYRNDEDMSPLNFYMAPGTETSTQQISQEIRLESPKNANYDWLVGLYYMGQKSDLDSPLVLGDKLLPPSVILPPGVTTGTLESKTTALFAHGNYTLSKQLQMTGGIRISRETKDMTFAQTRVPGFTVTVPQFSTGMADSDVSPKIGLNWFIQPETMLYGAISKGYKSGGYNMDTVTKTLTDPAQQLRFGKQEVQNVEFGWKTEFMNKKARLNGSIYSMDGSNWQVQQFVVSNGASVPTITNAGQVRINGMEVDFQAKLPRGFSLKSGLAYTDAKFVKFANGGGAGIDYDGNQLPFAPPLKASLTIEQTIPMDSRLLRWNLGVVHTDQQFANANNASASIMEANDIWNAGISLDSNKSKNNWVLTLGVKNLTNADYTSFVGTNAFLAPRAIYGAPRTVGLSLKYDL